MGRFKAHVMPCGERFRVHGKTWETVLPVSDIHSQIEFYERMLENSKTMSKGRWPTQNFRTEEKARKGSKKTKTRKPLESSGEAGVKSYSDMLSALRNVKTEIELGKHAKNAENGER